MVSFPNDSNVASKSLFFNKVILIIIYYPLLLKKIIILNPKPLSRKDWTVGKVLDQIAIIGKINNNNNQISTNDPRVSKLLKYLVMIFMFMFIFIYLFIYIIFFRDWC